MVVEVALPQGVQVTVGDGLRHILKRSGWRLCEKTSAVRELDALLTLAGSAWELRLDERARRVCFVTHEDAPEDGDEINAVQTFPLAGAWP